MNETPPNSLMQRTPRCPDDDRLAAFVEHRLSEAQASEMEAHVSTCDYCVNQVSFLLDLQDSQLPEVPAALLARVSSPPSARPWWSAMGLRWAPAAAALAGIVLVASVVLQRPAERETPSEPPVTHEQPSLAPAPAAQPQVPPQTTAPPPETRSQTPLAAAPRVIEPRSGDALSRQGFDLRWTPVPNALFYDVRITAPDGQLKWSKRVDSSQARVPGGDGLPAGTYFVWVRASLPEGKFVRAQAVSFTVQD